MISIKRVYQPYEKSDGFRVLVDRLWPRGVTKERAHADLWLKDIAPSNELRVWFGHDPEKWGEFQERYRRELKGRPGPVKELGDLVKRHRKVTLLFGAKDETHNEAVAIQKFLQLLG